MPIWILFIGILILLIIMLLLEVPAYQIISVFAIGLFLGVTLLCLILAL